LLVITPADHPSPVLTGFDERYWVIEDHNGFAVAASA
jgi:hypothetical protein